MSFAHTPTSSSLRSAICTFDTFGTVQYLLSCASSCCPSFIILLQIIRPCGWDLHQVATQLSQHLQLAQPEQVPDTIPLCDLSWQPPQNHKWSGEWIIMNHDPGESPFFRALWVTLYPTQPGGLYRGRWLLCGLSSYELPPSTLWATDDGGLHWCSCRSQCRVGDAFRAFSRCHGKWICGWVVEPVASPELRSWFTTRVSQFNTNYKKKQQLGHFSNPICNTKT